MRWREQLTRRFPALTRLGSDCYVVGGAVRDLLAGRDPADVDVACNDPLAAAQTLRRKVIRLGRDHLSAYRVTDGGHVYDFAELLDHDIDRDLARRDFTVNAMAVDLAHDTLLDPNGGQRDIASDTVRMVRPENFDEDPLRALKGVRMAVKYGMTIEPVTLEAIRSRAALISNVAPERATYELSVIFSSNAFRKAVALLRDTGLAAPLGLTLGDFHADDVTVAGAFALLLRSNVQEYAEHWRWSEQVFRDVLTLRRLVDHHDLAALFDAGERVARQLPPILRALARDDRVVMPDFATKPLLTGDEITGLTGVPPGRELGAIKRALVEAQLRGDVKDRDGAIAYVRNPLTA